MENERNERNNLTLAKLREVMDPWIKEQNALNKKLLSCYEQIAKDNSIKLGDYLIIHGSWFELLPGPKPIWLKASYMIKEGEAIITRGTPMKPNQM